MKTSVLALLCGALPVLALAADPQALLEQRFRGDRSGACVVAAVIDANEVRRARFCAAPRPEGEPDERTAFEIGSVTKTMTGFLVSDLVAQGKWSLDDPIARHLPPGTVLPRPISVRELLTHTAGLPALPSRMRITDPADPYAPLTEQDLLDSLRDVQTATPGYSNFGGMLLSLAVSNAHGGDYESALQRRLLAPRGMRETFVAASPAGVRRALPHVPGGQVVKPWTIAPKLAGVGMVCSTLDDMTAYVRGELAAGAPNPAWFAAPVQGRSLYLHEGGTGGFSSFVGFEPAAKRGVVVLSDTSLTNLGGLGDIGVALLGIERPLAPRTEVPVPAALRAAIVGDYELPGLPLSIRDEGGRLLLQAQGQPAFELRHDSRGDFYPLGLDALLQPQLQDGRVTGFVWRQGGGAAPGKRR